MALKVFRGIWFSIKDFEWYENISLRMMDWCKRYFLFFLWFLLYCSMFRNEERVVFIAIIVFFPLSCCLAFFLIFNQSSCFLWKLFHLKRFFSRNWYGCLAINQSSHYLWLCEYFLKAFLFQRFLAVIDFIVVLHIWILIN